VSGLLHAPAALPQGMSLGTHWRGDWVDPRAGLADVEKRQFLTLPGLELQPLGRPPVASRYTDYDIPDLYNVEREDNYESNNSDGYARKRS
jgi:hypothetical protein